MNSQTSSIVQNAGPPTALHRKWRTPLCFAAVFVIALSVRLVNLTQPLVEGYIDRQVHTAMMARNIARGESILYPQIDIGPFPAYYMLEFPGYPALTGVIAKISGWPLDVVGRSLSALSIALACLFLMDLVRRRECLPVACLAAVAMALMPVTIRYGRAFQPDSMMLACLIAAVWFTDRWSEGRNKFFLMVAGCLVGYALLLKVISAYVLIPLFYLVWKRCGWKFYRSMVVWTALLLATLPSLWWYTHAYDVASGLDTVSTPFWKLNKWIAPDRLLQESTYRQLAYFIGLRVLTPVGLVLAAVGVAARTGSRLFHFWTLGLVTYVPILARKVDHEHYYLAIAPVAAVFVARALYVLWNIDLSRYFFVPARGVAVAAGIGLVAVNLLACKSTFQDPDEWVHVRQAANAAMALSEPRELVAGHSAVLFYADRRGYPMAYGRSEVRYLLGTFGDTYRAVSTDAPVDAGTESTVSSRQSMKLPGSTDEKGQRHSTDLLEFYRSQGARYFVELLGTGRELDNPEFFRELRAHYRVIAEHPGQYVIFDLQSPSSRGFAPIAN